MAAGSRWLWRLNFFLRARVRNLPCVLLIVIESDTSKIKLLPTDGDEGIDAVSDLSWLTTRLRG
jgi:hypothetical protein